MVGGYCFGGIKRSSEVARVDGVELDVRQSLRHCFGLEAASVGEGRVEVALRFVVQVSFGFTVANQVDRVR